MNGKVIPVQPAGIFFPNQIAVKEAALQLYVVKVNKY